MPGLAYKYLRYYLTSVGPHGIHSPYIYELVTKVLHDKTPYPAYAQVENLRKSLLSNQQALPITDFGAGGSVNSQYTRTVADIARRAAKPPKLAKLLYRLCAWHKPQYMLELGTSLGISAAYQALGANPQQFISLE
ncbi:MAG TPA: SAM-dependent methyltransferase, partial [Bacteroidia bacterium]|nr:SAM-dependent methyltransferase [Bacteroidia bacterium]